MVNSLKASACHVFIFLSWSVVGDGGVGEGREIWVDFRKERKLSHAVECKALGDGRKSVEEVGGIG